VGDNMNPSNILGLNVSLTNIAASNSGNAGNPPVLTQAEYKETLDTADALQQNKEDLAGVRNKWASTILFTVIGLFVGGVGGFVGFSLGFLADTTRANQAETALNTTKSSLTSALAGKNIISESVTKVQCMSSNPVIKNPNKSELFHVRLGEEMITGNVYTKDDMSSKLLCFSRKGKNYLAEINKDSQVNSEMLVLAAIVKHTLETADPPSSFDNSITSDWLQVPDPSVVNAIDGFDFLSGFLDFLLNSS